MNRRTLFFGAGAFALVAGLGAGASLFSSSAAAESITVHKTPTCGCCGAWVEHLKQEGFDVSVHDYDDVDMVKDKLGVPLGLRSCHTAEVAGYVVEGHVPASDIRRLLTEKPNALGLSVPGMPIGSPGMEMGDHKDPYDVILFGVDAPKVFASH